MPPNIGIGECGWRSRGGSPLTALGCELVWATTWSTEDANDLLAPWLGLPPLAAVDWPDPADEEDGPGGPDGPGSPGSTGGPHWKIRTLVDRAAGRPFVWIDDEIGAADRTWVAAHHPGPALLHRVDHRYGLTDADFDVVGEWLRR